MVKVPPGSVNLLALCSRFPTIWASRIGSPIIHIGRVRNLGYQSQAAFIYALRWSSTACRTISAIAQLSLKPNLPPRNARYIEQVIHHLRHMFGLALDHLSEFHQRRLGRSFQPQQLHGGTYDAKRIAQLVPEHCEEFILPAIGLAQSLVGFFAIRNVDWGADKTPQILHRTCSEERLGQRPNDT